MMGSVFCNLRFGFGLGFSTFAGFAFLFGALFSFRLRRGGRMACFSESGRSPINLMIVTRRWALSSVMMMGGVDSTEGPEGETSKRS